MSDIEKLEGSGKIFSNQEFIADVEYEIRIYGDYTISRPLDGSVPSKIPGRARAEIRISGARLRFGQHLTLDLSDGRKLDFLVDSDSGPYQSTGPLY